MPSAALNASAQQQRAAFKGPLIPFPAVMERRVIAPCRRETSGEMCHVPASGTLLEKWIGKRVSNVINEKHRMT